MALPLIPQMLEFTNQVVLALSNAFPPQVYSDPTQATVNHSVIAAISSITIDAYGVADILSGPHGINVTQGIGANVVVAGVSPAQFNGTFVVIAIPDSTHVKVVNLGAIGQTYSSGGTLTVTTIPVISNFTVSYPDWSKATAYPLVSLPTYILPTVGNAGGYYFQLVQGGTSNATTEPTWPQTIGTQISDGSAIWVNKGVAQNAGPDGTAPPPPGAAHIAVYGGALWVLDTWYTDNANGIDGPTSLRMSDVDNLNSWNPVNQAFLDKDDGTEGMGLAVFTISAQGIPPQGSLVAFKLYAAYQAISIFGAANFAIQRVVTDMGCIAPRTIQFIPGFGIGRLSHLGTAIFDGVNDRVVSEPIRPYLFPSNDPETSDIVAMDAMYQSVAWAAQTANPPQYVVAIPIGISGGQLTRLLVFDLVGKGWAIVDLPFPISTLAQIRTPSANAVTVMGSFSDGTLQRWQAGDQQWATSAAGSGTPAFISWMIRAPVTASKNPDERLYCRRVVVRGYMGQTPSGVVMNVQSRASGVVVGNQNIVLPSSAGTYFSVDSAVEVTDDIFDAIIEGTGQITLDGLDFHMQPKPLGALTGLIA